MLWGGGSGASSAGRDIPAAGMGGAGHRKLRARGRAGSEAAAVRTGEAERRPDKISHRGNVRGAARNVL